MKTAQQKRKHLDAHEVFKLYNTFIFNSEKGYRTLKNGQRIRPDSVKNYTYTLKHLEDFVRNTGFDLKIFRVDRLGQKEIEKAQKYWKRFYYQFTEYLYKKGHYDNYVGFTIKNLRVFFNYLNNEMQISCGNFHKSFYVPKEEIPIVVLHPDQLRYLIHDRELNRQLTPELQTIRDVFVFGCTVALRFSDLMSLKSHHLKKEGEAVYLRVRSQKTGAETNIRLPLYAIEILKRYKGRQTTLLPRVTNAHFNRQLKQMSRCISDTEPMVKIRLRNNKPVIIYKDAKKRTHYTLADHITTHTMRRTAITTMLRLGMPEQVVRRISGHAAGSKEFYKYVFYAQSYVDHETEKVFDQLSRIA